MKIDPNKLETLDRTAQNIVSGGVNAVSPVAGQVLDWKMARYNRDTYGDEAQKSRDNAVKVGAKPKEFFDPKIIPDGDEQAKELKNIKRSLGTTDADFGDKGGVVTTTPYHRIGMRRDVLLKKGWTGGYAAGYAEPDALHIPKSPKIPAYLAPLAPLNALYKNPELQQAARDSGNGYHDPADDVGRKDAPTDGEIDKLNKSISASESRDKAVKVGAKPQAYIDPLTVGVVAGNIALTSAAAWGAGKVGGWIGDKLVGNDANVDNTKKATEGAQSFATTTIDILPALGTLGAVGVATYAGSKLIGAGYDALTKKPKKTKEAKTVGTKADNGVVIPGYKDDGEYDNYPMSEDLAQQSRANAVCVGAKPKEFFDPVNAALAGIVALPVAYGVGKATDYVYDVVTGKKQKEQAAKPTEVN